MSDERQPPSGHTPVTVCGKCGWTFRKGDELVCLVTEIDIVGRVVVLDFVHRVCPATFVVTEEVQR